MKKSTIIKNTISLVILIGIVTFLLIYFNKTYLYLPFTVPSSITKELGITYESFKKPVTVEVLTYENLYSAESIKSSYFPEDKTQYEKLAREMVGFYSRIVSNGNKIAYGSYEVQNLNTSGIRYYIDLRCGESMMTLMDFMDSNEIIRMGNDNYYTITPALREQLINYIKETYPIKDIIK